VWYPGHAFDDAPEDRTPLGHCQHHADAACQVGSTHARTAA
jgi:hypothetical protein